MLGLASGWDPGRVTLKDYAADLRARGEEFDPERWLLIQNNQNARWVIERLHGARPAATPHTRPPDPASAGRIPTEEYAVGEWRRIRDHLAHEPTRAQFARLYRLPREQAASATFAEGIDPVTVRRFLARRGLAWPQFVELCRRLG